MKAKVLLPAMLPLAVLASGCTMLDRPSPSQPPKPTARIAPITEVVHGAADADYQLGRYFQGRNLRDEAIAAYRRALEADPKNVEAHNGLGVVYASLERYGESEAEFKAAIALAPKAVHLHNNLGYCYLLQGRKEEALARFRDALALDPGNRRLLENIALAEASDKDRQGGGPGPAVPVPPAPPPKGVPAESAGGVETTSGLVRVAPNVYELPAMYPRRDRAMQGRPVEHVVKLDGLEIANGNGITGMARRTARYLASHQIQGHARLTNQKPYRQVVTEIQYRPEYERQARYLSALLTRPPRLVASNELRHDVGLRVVLGKDAVSKDTAMPPTVLAVAGDRP